ncbi:MAG: branched-chain amino acid transport system permease protein [Micromonosporaceae bacterium]|nr:branched-chain amino acid transport system permease protein [Micromonosporaceae bacterium]
MNWGQAIADAISLGALYGLVAVGIGLVFGVMRLINFAYGELITAGAYVLAYTSGWPVPLAIITCVAAVVALALAQERIAFRPLRRMGASPAAMLVATFAVSFLLQAIYLLAFGTRGQIVGTLGQLNRAFTVDGVDIRWIALVATVTGAVLLLGTGALLNRTTMGLHVRAAAQDFRTARILGVRANRVIGFSFVVAGVLAAAVSVLYTVSNPLVQPQMGVPITIFALVGVVVGGPDRLWSAALGGFAVGFAYGMFGDLLSSQQTVYLPAVVYGSVILVLLLRPAGLFAPFRARQVERV